MELRTKVFGLTGGIACGKSTATNFLKKENIPIIDADQVSRDIVVPGSVGLHQIISAFGKEILQNDGSLDRKRLSDIVFPDKARMKIINQIMRPLIDGHVDALVNMYKNAGVKLVCYDAALIIEAGNANKYRPLIVVACSPETQLARLMKRNSLSEAEAMSRINAQMPSAEKIKFADYVVDTNGSLEDSEKQVVSIIQELKRQTNE